MATSPNPGKAWLVTCTKPTRLTGVLLMACGVGEIFRRERSKQ